MFPFSLRVQCPLLRPRFLPLALLALSSCSQNYMGPESFAEKIARYQAVPIKEFPSPQFPSMLRSGELLSQEKARPSEQQNLQHQQGRSLASTTATTTTKSTRPPLHPAMPTVTSYTEISNRQLYFLVLLEQYYALSFAQGVLPHKIPQCPSFHSALLQFKETHKRDIKDKSIANAAGDSQLPEEQYKKLWASVQQDPYQQSLLPELLLPLEDGVSTTTAQSLQQNAGTAAASLVQKSLQWHLSSLQQELHELCFHSSGQNYYIFENLISLQAEWAGSRQTQPQQMATLLKTRVYTNWALLSAIAAPQFEIKPPQSNPLAYLSHSDSQKRQQKQQQRQHRAPAGMPQSSNLMVLMNEMNRRLGVSWVHLYFTEMQSRRQQLLESVAPATHHQNHWLFFQ